MEVVGIVAGVKNDTGINGSLKKTNRIQVSNTKKPLFFYVNLAKRYMRQHNEVELSALGMAIATVVTISEILKNNGLAIQKKILTSTVDMKDENKGRLVQKAKIEILLGKTENFDSIVAAAASEIVAAATTTSEIPSAAATANETPAATATRPEKPAAAATAHETPAAAATIPEKPAVDVEKEDVKPTTISSVA